MAINWHDYNHSKKKIHINHFRHDHFDENELAEYHGLVHSEINNYLFAENDFILRIILFVGEEIIDDSIHSRMRREHRWIKNTLQMQFFHDHFL